MTPVEIKKLIKIAAANFPNMQQKELAPTAELWIRMLGDIPYKVAEAAIIKILSTNKFFPTVAEIREAALELTTSQVPTAIEAWGEVIRAIRNYGWNREREALESLSPITAKVVMAIGWQDICASEEPDVIRGQFRRAYETQVSREKDIAVLPLPLKQMITNGALKKLAASI